MITHNKIKNFFKNKQGETGSDDPFINSIETHYFTVNDEQMFDEVYQTILEFYDVPTNLKNGDKICIFGNQVFDCFNATVEEIYEYTNSNGFLRYCARVNLPYFHLENNDEIVLLDKTYDELISYNFVLNKVVPFGYPYFIDFRINYREVDSEGLTVWEKAESVPYANYSIKMYRTDVKNDYRSIVVDQQVFDKYVPKISPDNTMKMDIHIVCAGNHSAGYKGIFQISRENPYCSYDQDSIDLLRQKHNMLVAMIGDSNDFGFTKNNQTVAESLNYILKVVDNKMKDPMGLIIALS